MLRNIAALLIILLASTSFAAEGEQPIKRTKVEVDKIMEDVGKTPPDWWDGTAELSVPPTLDLTFTQHPGGWQPKVNFGAYMWDIIDPNPDKWRGAVKLIQGTLVTNKGNADAQQKAMANLARIYTEMLADYPRGGYWAKKANAQPILLAECYLKLGCKEATIDMLKKMGPDGTRNGQVIKMWADVGDLKTALVLAEQKAASNPTAAYLAAADACRLSNNIPQAIKYYNQVTAAKTSERDADRNRKRAAASLEAIKLFDSLNLTKIGDGKYTADSIGYVGPVVVAVTVADHKIEKVEVTQHHEKQFYASITAVPPRIVAKQSVKGIDATTGATITSEAIINASAKALAGAQK